MDKNKFAASSITVAKTTDKGSKKIIFTLTAQNILKAFACFATQFSVVFSSMSPFGIAFYASVFSTESWIINLAASILGAALSGKQFFRTYALVLIAVTAIFAVSDKVSKSAGIRALVSGGLLLIFGAIKYMRIPYTTLDIIALILESALVAVGVFVFTYGFDIFLNYKKRSFISEKEHICAYAALAIVILALKKLPSPTGLDISNVVSMVIIFILCLSSNPKSALIPSILLGVIGAMGTSEKSGIMGTFAFGALLAGSLRRYGKTGVVLGFITANTASSLFLSDAEQIVLSIYDSFAASLIFMFTPGSVVRYFSELSAKAGLQYAPAEKTSANQPDSERLQKISGSLKRLSAIYEEVGQPRSKNTNYIKNAVNPIKEKICFSCPSKESCYSPKSGYMYETVQKYLDSPSLKIVPSTLDDRLKNVCHRKDGICSLLSPAVYNIRNESRWIAKLNESKKLISEQLLGISAALENESSRIGVGRNPELEERLWVEFDKSDLFPLSLHARDSNIGGFEIKVCFKDCDADKKLASRCRQTVEKVTGMKTEFGGSEKNKGTINLSYYQSMGYTASFGYATKPKYGEKVNGDSFNVIYTDRSRMVMALSDGMGSGEEAAKESSLVINMLESFLNSGIECDTAIKLINSGLLLKGSRESFATIDICDVDLADKTLTFTKLGAAGAYIKSSDTVRKICGKSLPAGILTEVKAEKHMLPIDSECVVLLVSDGVADIALKSDQHDNWIENELMRISNSNPQIIAGKIMEKALKLSGKTANDDMTVIVGCICGQV